MVPGVHTMASVKASAAFWEAGEIAVLEVVDGGERVLVGPGHQGRAASQGGTDPALVLAGASQADQLGGHRVHGIELGNRTGEQVEGAPQPAGRMPVGGWSGRSDRSGGGEGIEQDVQGGVGPGQEVHDEHGCRHVG